MDITDVKVFPVDEDKLKAYATITFDNCFIVRDLKVIAGNKGFFIAMPSKKRKDGTFRDIAHPLNAETRARIEQSVLDVFNAERPAGTPAATLEAYEAHEATEASIARAPAEKRTERPVPEAEVPTPTSESQPATGIPDIKTPDDPAKAFGYEEK
jgi:stage V sporulation protein G